jgi:hypothetical protein
LEFLGEIPDPLLELHLDPPLFPSVGLEKQSHHHGKGEGHRYGNGKLTAPVRGAKGPDQNQRGEDQRSD